MTDIRIFQPVRILSAASAGDLTHWVRSQLKAGARYFVVDLKQVLFMDSSGLGCLILAQRMVTQVGGVLALCSLSGQARMLLEMANTEQMIPVYDSVEDFENSLKLTAQA